MFLICHIKITLFAKTKLGMFVNIVVSYVGAKFVESVTQNTNYAVYQGVEVH